MQALISRSTRIIRICNRHIRCMSAIPPKNNSNKNNNYFYKRKRDNFELISGAVISSAVAIGLYSMYRYTKANSTSVYIEDNNKTNSLRGTFNFINKVVEKCAPAVVYVEIKDPSRIDRSTENAMIVSNGSGFIIDEDGSILTNAHVVVNKPHATIEVKLHDGSVHTAKVMEADMNIDLALIKIDTPKKLPVLKLADEGDVSVGEWVVALGSPLSLSHTATAGVVSSVNRAADELGLQNFQMKYIQTDAPITFGNSGGPLVNLDGNVIGINNLRITAGISFAIPSEYATGFINRFKFNAANKKTPQPQFGVTAITMTQETLNDLRAKHESLQDTNINGVLVWKVLAGSIGSNGLFAGDIITHVDGKPISKAADFYSILVNYKNKPFSLSIVRNGDHITVKFPPIS